MARRHPNPAPRALSMQHTTGAGSRAILARSLVARCFTRFAQVWYDTGATQTPRWCMPVPTYAIDATTWRSPNYSRRAHAPTAIVVHSCEGALPSPRATSLPWLCTPASHVSTGYYVCRDTTIYQLVDDMNEAWHAGGLQESGIWTAQPAYSNPHSLGIECEHRSGQDWPKAQKDALAWLLCTLSATYTIPATAIETHGQIAIAGPYSRKIDPTNWPHAAFVAWRDVILTTPPTPPAPLTKHYRVKRTMISQRQAGGAPYAGELAPGEEVVADVWYADNGGTIHLQDDRGFVLLSELESV